MKKFLLTFGVFLALSVYANAQTRIPPNVEKLLKKNTCTICHNADKRLVGPSFVDIAKTKKYKAEEIIELIYKPNPKNWPGYPPMAPMAKLPKDEAKIMADWIVSLNK